MALAGAVLAGFGSITAGLVRLQVGEHVEMSRLARDNHIRLEVLRAPRGSIYDCNGVLLADSAPSFSIVFRPFPAESLQTGRSLLDSSWVARIAGLVEADTGEVRTAVALANKTGKTAVLRRNAPFYIRAAVEEGRDGLPGVEVQIEPLRRYPNGIMAAHLLGYAGEINDEELVERQPLGYNPGDLIGRSGIERSYEDMLRGQDGAEFVIVNAMGRRVSTLSEGPPRLPVAGHDLVLTLDIKVQQALEEAMEDVERGAAIAIDPRDGGVLGLVSRPAFDPNEFSVGLTQERWKSLTGGGANPLLNRVIQGVYPPGSTFKVVTMLGALRYGIANAGTRLVPCSGSYQFGGRSFGCWKREGHGSLDFIGALQHSCDVYFYQIGPRLGLARLEQAARDFGLGERTGIDLPEEKKGLIPNEAWYERRFGAGKGRKGTMLNLAIGQGELLVTPLQLALMMAEVSTDGRTVRPHVVREVRGTGPLTPPRPARDHIAADRGNWKTLRQALALVVESGTGTAARVPGFAVAGKTGTAQNPHGEDHALFVGYAPADDPRIAFAFVIENSGHGGSIAAPRAGFVLRRLLLADSTAVRPPSTLAVATGDSLGGSGD